MRRPSDLVTTEADLPRPALAQTCPSGPAQADTSPTTHGKYFTQPLIRQHALWVYSAPTALAPYAWTAPAILTGFKTLLLRRQLLP